MSEKHMFVRGWPPAKSAYDGRIRAFVLRNPRRRGGKKKNTDETLRDENENFVGELCSADLDTHSILDAKSLKQDDMDPFNSFARPLTKHEKYLARNYAEGPYLWESHAEMPPGFRPSLEIYLHVNLQSLMTIEIMLAYSAKAIADLHPEDLEARKEVHRRKARSFAALVQNLDQQGAETIKHHMISVCGIICMLIETPGSHGATVDTELRCHARGLASLIEKAGGMHEVSVRWHEVGWLIYWVMSFGYVHDTLCSELSCCYLSESPIKGKIFELPRPSDALAELVVFYMNAYETAKQRYLSPSDEISMRSTPVMSLFCEGTIAWTIMSIKHQIPVDRIVPLVFVNVLFLHSCSASPEANESIYAMYHDSLEATKLELSLSAAPLMWALMTDMKTKRLSDCQILQQTFRLLYTFRKLSPDVASVVTDALFDFISIPPDPFSSNIQNTHDIVSVRKRSLIETVKAWPSPSNLRNYVNGLRTILKGLKE